VTLGGSFLSEGDDDEEEEEEEDEDGDEVGPISRPSFVLLLDLGNVAAIFTASGFFEYKRKH
jgi:hypothetical protein